ncbi:FMN-binding negative transcriptional regulator [Pseudohalocynthiibacter aestuariivivens]|jgi:transcriptional regulator|uniref:FMN-binding negative transcriptional regulator n=1 Tax=Pseudohalocynthiibacter aestuariivivens TaxID=1591409 RepID=A0ABV5JLR0_9RHOB|nr:MULTISPECIES: FMN-binding negative transcriptional regulator [Pseudohalocynthiibacter]MBS9718226.1 FMN-binding negative transcriptional regulator [Pseudohalocynthiibacter aestuariivivens]MCK0103449.1 FMN-binding negative transcriptional regulator [Pseudohalocynthiibacter sp. F2068]
MHPNPAFRQMPDKANRSFAQKCGFGILSVNGSEGPLLSHVPFLLSDDGKVAELHLVRSNPIVRTLSEPEPAVVAVSGPDSYVSPDWYGIDDQVPTWNYVAVHLRGQLIKEPQEKLRGLLDRLSARFEADLLPKTPWVSGKMSDGVMDKMMRQIVPIRLEITSIDGTWKLGQNKTDEVRSNAASQMDASGTGHETRHLSALMMAPSKA